MKRWLKDQNLIFGVLLIFLVRLFLAFLPGFEIDVHAWLAWAHRLTEIGPQNFYSDEIWTQYTPGFLYWLWLLGKLGWVNEILVKLPAILADIITGLLLWQLILPRSKKWAGIALLAYTLNPAALFISSVWGQIDGLLALFLFLAVYFVLREKPKPWLSGLSWAVAFLLKPQAVALLPILFFLWWKKFSGKEILASGLASLGLIFLGTLPFFPEKPFLGLAELIVKMGQFYSHTSLFAANFWALATGLWQNDQTLWQGLKYVTWGGILYAFFVGLILFKLIRQKDGDKDKGGNSTGYFLAAGLSLFAFFLFPTRVHERYLFPMLVFWLAHLGLKKKKTHLYLFFITSLVYLLNLYHPYAYYSKNFLVNSQLLQLTGSLMPTMALFFLAVFFWLLFQPQKHYLKKHLLKLSQFIPKIKKVRSQQLLLLILIFSFLVRFIGLNYPTKEYFDEVYHAFTARQILHQNPKAWEWWNPHPQGFAYEWTHPPLAKLGMVFGMLILGENPLGWRAPQALLGVGTVFLVYLIANKLFQDKRLAILSATVFSFEGLAIVMSRIGMNDTYFLFFMLLSLYLFLEQKDFLSATSLGLAAASKWTVAWFLPILALAHFSLKRKIKVSYLWYFLLPPAIYLASYLPLFLTGHDFSIFVEMQKQMWWYHTQLEATHPYTSAWWTWPLMLRPIWLFVEHQAPGFIANIYAMGNPIVFWFGLLAVAYSLWWALRKRKRELGLILFAYFIFFVSWAGSPRVMFLYHYLPSIPFLAILIGFVLRQNQKLIWPFLSLSFLVLIYFLPHLIGLSVPAWLNDSYFWLPSWR